MKLSLWENKYSRKKGKGLILTQMGMKWECVSFKRWANYQSHSRFITEPWPLVHLCHCSGNLLFWRVARVKWRASCSDDILKRVHMWAPTQAPKTSYGRRERSFPYVAPKCLDLWKPIMDEGIYMDPQGMARLEDASHGRGDVASPSLWGENKSEPGRTHVASSKTKWLSQLA